jgi:hypothetical protein
MPQRIHKCASSSGRTLMRVEKFAAEELVSHLQHLYPDQHFSVTTSLPRGSSYILLGTITLQPNLGQFVPAASLAKPESFG